MRYQSRRPVVVLGRGYIGSSLEDSMGKAHRPHYCIRRSKLDYHDKLSVRSMLRKIQPEAVVMAFGFTGSPNVDACEDEPERTYDFNCYTPAMIARECADAKVHCIALSTGCIFDGYEKEFTVNDSPNNGLGSPTASVYCQSKHSFEKEVSNLPLSIVRLRMPYDGRVSPRNYLWKLMQYPSLLNKMNSKTFVPDLVRLVLRLADHSMPDEQHIYHAVNPLPVGVSELVSMYFDADLYRRDWALVDHIDTKASRSNCILKNTISRRLSYFLNDRFCIESSLKMLKSASDKLQAEKHYE